MHRTSLASLLRFSTCLAAVGALALAGCNQYSTPAIQSTSAGTAPSHDNGESDRSVNPLNNQADPSETTGSLGGAPAGTASAQTAPSSSNGIR